LPLLAQQSGGIRGMVYDKEFDAPLAGAQVSIAETGAKAVATDEGNYIFNQVEPGRYTLVFSKDGYTRQVSSDVVVSGGQMTDVNSSLSGEFTEMEEFVAQDLEIGGNSEEGLLNLRMESPALMDSVSSDLMSRAGASDAAGALRLVSGATVQDGKYAVVRGLPDRYVVSQMNGVRLPSADPDKRAVQLDQFPSALIESIQVSKTFTPDQQGDASGGAVNVVLKGVPDENILKVKVGTKYKTNVNGEDFLTYKDGGLNYWGTDTSQDPQEWNGAVGVRNGDAPAMYDWEVTSGGKHNLGDEIKVGGLANFYYKSDASSYDDGVDDKFDANAQSGNPSPSSSTKTSLFDTQQSTEEVQWGGLGVLGVETEHHKVKLLYMQTHVAEDTATLAEDTRGKELYFPGYDPYDLTDPGNSPEFINSAPYRRYQTLEYSERDTSTLQLGGEHTIPFPEIGIPNVVALLEPEVDWTLSKNSSELYTPDKRLFGVYWTPSYERRGTVRPSTYVPDNPAENINVGNLQRIWQDVVEDGEQFAFNTKMPFEQWSGDKGYIKLGMFHDGVDREYTQDSYSADTGSYEADWNTPWNYFSDGSQLAADDIDVNYDGRQEINAWYYMADVPLCSFFKAIGGTRYESTSLNITLDPEGSVFWVPPGSGVSTTLNPGDGDVDFEQKDVLPSLGFEFKPVDSLVFKAMYSETVARQTFKELTPVQQTEYLGADIFIGNPELEMSALKNYDLRADWIPYQGGLVSVSWFEKDVTDAIEYTQAYAQNIGEYITPVNYPEGTLTGFELELRQQLDRFWEPLKGLGVGANATFIQSEVTISDEDQAALEGLGYPMETRNMLNAPEYLYNFNLTYDIEKTGTKMGLFYTVQGDTLVTGPNVTRFVPEVYAKEYGTFNFSLSQKIGKRWTLGLAAKNILNPEIETVYRSDYMTGDVPKTSYTKGREFSVSLGCEF
jgi:outer membrane receptor protein involved in Fe transport